MKPDAIYDFNQVFEAKTRYRLITHTGKEIPNFPAFWKRGERAGQGYVVFRKAEDHRPGHTGAKFDYALTLDGNRLVSGFNFSPGEQYRAFGDYGQDAILLFLSPDYSRLELQFFEGMKSQAAALFQGKFSNAYNKSTKHTEFATFSGTAHG